MLVSRILLPRKHRQLRERNQQISKYLKQYKLRDSVLSPNSDTAGELMCLEELEREMKFNNKLQISLLMWLFLSFFGIKPKI